MTKSDAQRFTELTGGCWHDIYWQDAGSYSFKRCTCGDKIITEGKHKNPTYSNAADILNRMKQFCGEERYLDFIRQNGFDGENGDTIFIEIDLVLNPPLLLKKAIEFLEAQ